jgi:hypothetical protein
MILKSSLISPIIGYLYSVDKVWIGDLVLYCCTFNGNASEGTFLIR